jgi:hypothetical protein
MYSGVGPAGSMGYRPAIEETLQNPLDFTLNRASHRLALPPDKAAAVVVKSGEEGPAHLAAI